MLKYLPDRILFLHMIIEHTFMMMIIINIISIVIFNRFNISKVKKTVLDIMTSINYLMDSGKA